MKHELPGSALDAFTHVALYGLASILRDTGAERVRAWWNDQADAVATVSWSGPTDAAEAVLEHAQSHARADSWVQATFDHQGRDTAVFSPRIAAPASADAWAQLAAARRRILDDPEGSLSPLDHQMIGALGEPAYWHETSKDPQPDLGATRWEMKTRNRGEEFVGQRLAPLAKEVAARTVEEVAKGLSGHQVVDELGRNQPDSRTATGLTRPGPVDNALAWCALWGIATITLVPQSNAMSQTAGSTPRKGVHPTHMALPVITRPTTQPLWKTIIASRAFDTVAFRGHSMSPTEHGAATVWLQSKGVVAVVRFPTRIAGSSSAPERTILTGAAHLLSGKHD